MGKKEKNAFLKYPKYPRRSTITICAIFRSAKIFLFLVTLFCVNSKEVIGTMWQWFMAWNICFIPRQPSLFVVLLFCKMLEGPSEHIPVCLLHIGSYFYQDKPMACLMHIMQKRVNENTFKHCITLSYQISLSGLWILRSNLDHGGKGKSWYNTQEKQFSRPCAFHAEIHFLVAKEHLSPSIDWLL